MAAGQGEGNLTAHRVTGGMSAIDPLRIQEPRGPIGQLCHPECLRGPGGVAIAGQIGRDHRLRELLLRQAAQGGPPRVGGAAQAVQQEEREFQSR